MSKYVEVRGVKIGEGVPKICVPIVGKTKEEILAAMRERQKKNASYQWKKTCTLTLQEGEILETEILPKHECANVSQLVKKICRGELIVSQAEPSESN